MLLDLFSLDSFLPHFRPCDDTLVNSCYLGNFQIVGCIQMNNLLMDKEQFSREYHVV